MDYSNSLCESVCVLVCLYGVAGCCSLRLCGFMVYRMDAVVILQTDTMVGWRSSVGLFWDHRIFIYFLLLKMIKKERAQGELYFNVVMLPSLKTHQTPDD